LVPHLLCAKNFKCLISFNSTKSPGDSQRSSVTYPGSPCSGQLPRTQDWCLLVMPGLVKTTIMAGCRDRACSVSSKRQEFILSTLTSSKPQSKCFIHLQHHCQNSNNVNNKATIVTIAVLVLHMLTLIPNTTFLVIMISTLGM
jgi:hypothetical protein